MGKQEKQLPTVDQHERILVSFNHAVALVISGRAIFVGCAVCEEIYHGKVTVGPKTDDASVPTGTEAVEMAERLTIDFPIFLRVLSLADGKLLPKPIEILVKWNNISAICHLREGDVM